MSARMQSLLALETKQAETTKRLDRLRDILDETGLSDTRRGGKVLAEETKRILEHHSSEMGKIVLAHLSKDEFMLMIDEGFVLLRQAVLAEPPDLLGILAVGPDGLRKEHEDRAAEIIAGSPGYSEEEKKLSKVVFELSKFASDSKAAQKALRHYKLTSILHLTLRNGKKKAEETQIDEALIEFEGEDVKMAPQWYETAPAQLAKTFVITQKHSKYNG